MDCGVMPRDKFVYVVEGGFTGLSHCFLSAHGSTVCSCRMLGFKDVLERKTNIIFCIYIHLF